jgi:hypothetical protein
MDEKEARLTRESLVRADRKATDEQIDDQLKEISNKTLKILLDIKLAHTWQDIEKMSDFVDILKKVKDAEKEVVLNDKEATLVKEIAKTVAQSQGIKGSAVDQFLEFYRKFEL